MCADSPRSATASFPYAIAAALAAAFVLAACGGPRTKIELDPGATATSCPPTCPPMVMVSVVRVGPGFAIGLSQDPIEFGPSGRGPILWKIDETNSSAGWRFTNDGIEIRDHGGEFDSPTPGPKVFTWNNRNSKSGTYAYKYTIRVTDGTTTYVLDPTIRNQN